MMVILHDALFKNRMVFFLLISIKCNTGKMEFFPFMGNLPFNMNGHLKISMAVSV